MGRGALVIVFAFAAHAHVEELELAAKHPSGTEDFVDELVDQLTTKLVDKVQNTWLLRSPEVDNTTLAWKLKAPLENFRLPNLGKTTSSPASRPALPFARSPFPWNRFSRTNRVVKQQREDQYFSERKMPFWKAAIATFSILTVMSGVALPAIAADSSIGTCVVSQCKTELAACILNPKCLANVICINSCVDRPDEAQCQIRCGDNFENEQVGAFNACAVSQKKCVPQKPNDGSYPAPALAGQVKSFDTSIWNIKKGQPGRWYITAGLNQAFDTFDCQKHFFTSPYPGKFYAKLFWRVNEPDGEFITKEAVQRFVQDPENPAHLINHDNEYLHYKDDWFVLDADDGKGGGEPFVLAYYQGSNDAWDGYGGAFVYTRAPSLPKELVPRLTEAMDRAELPYKWKDFSLTDNSCKVLEEDPTVLRERFAEKLIIFEENALQEALTSARAQVLTSIESAELAAVKGAEKQIQGLEKKLEGEIQELSNKKK